MEAQDKLFQALESQLEFDDSDLQEMRLLGFQRSHSERLHELGMFDKAAAALDDFGRSCLNDFTIASVHLREKIDRDDSNNAGIRQEACIRFSSPSFSPDGSVIAWHFSYVVVMHRFKEDFSLKMDGGFTMEEGIEFFSMADELDKARLDGVLPGLASDCSRILKN
jgi:hypothetical protein